MFTALTADTPDELIMAVLTRFKPIINAWSIKIGKK